MVEQSGNHYIYCLQMMLLVADPEEELARVADRVDVRRRRKLNA